MSDSVGEVISSREAVVNSSVGKVVSSSSEMRRKKRPLQRCPGVKRSSQL